MTTSVNMNKYITAKASYVLSQEHKVPIPTARPVLKGANKVLASCETETNT